MTIAVDLGRKATKQANINYGSSSLETWGADLRWCEDYFILTITRVMATHFLVNLLFDSFLASIQTCQNMATRFISMSVHVSVRHQLYPFSH